MKRLHLSRFCSLTASWLVLAMLSPALLAQPAEDFAGRLRDAFERHGWEMQQAPDGSLMYYPPQPPAQNQASTERLRQALERRGWRMETRPDGSLIYWPPRIETPVILPPATAEPGAARKPPKPGEAPEQPGPQTKPASDVHKGAPAMAVKPGTAASIRAPGSRPSEDRVKSAVDKKTPTRTSGAASRIRPPEQRRRTPQRSGYYYGYPRYRPAPPARYRTPPEGYRSARPPCPYGPWDCGWPAGRQPGSQAPARRQ